MFRELFIRMTQDAGTQRPLLIALSVAAAGLILWPAGARVSRSLYTLVGVTLGAWAGLNLPRWCGWEIDAMATAIGGALVLGFVGYWLHMLWIGATLSTLLGITAAFVAWHRVADHSAWMTVPAAVDPSASLAANVRSIYGALPAEMPHAIPLAAIIASITGGLIVFFWPKLGRVLALTLLGGVMLVVGGLVAVALAKPQWLDHLPQSTQTRGVALAILVLVGTVIQWMLCPRAPKPHAESQAPSAEGSVVSAWRAQAKDARVTPQGLMKNAAKEARA